MFNKRKRNYLRIKVQIKEKYYKESFLNNKDKKKLNYCIKDKRRQQKQKKKKEKKKTKFCQVTFAT